MMKLLHERLREFIDTCKDNVICYRFDGKGYYMFLNKEEFEALEDEIERDYMPRPRDNKGIPYRIGDTVYSTDPETEYSAEVTDIHERGIIRITWEDGCHDLVDKADIQHEPPQPKVYDADGVEINVGDTVWRTDTGAEVEVLGFDFDGIGDGIQACVTVGNGIHWNPMYLTHKEPVLDADGVPINIGDTVWSVQNGKQAVVSDIGQFETEYSKGNVMLEGISECYKGTLFTHNEPDSLERIKADREMPLFAYQDTYGIEDVDAHLLDRAIALIERGA